MKTFGLSKTDLLCLRRVDRADLTWGTFLLRHVRELSVANKMETTPDDA